VSVRRDAVHAMVGTSASGGYEFFFAFARARAWIMVGMTVGNVHNRYASVGPRHVRRGDNAGCVC